MKKYIVVGIIFLFIVTSVSPIVIGYNNETRDMEQISKNIILNKVNKHNYPEGYSTGKINNIKNKNDVNSDELPFQKKTVRQFINKEFAGDSPEIVEEPIDSPWPMQGYNRQHIARSPYSTISNSGIEKWRFPAGDWCWGSPSIGPEGTIFFGSTDGYLYAVYPNGTLKWKFESENFIGNMGDHPAIADDGTIYFGTSFGSWIQAVNPDGTTKWKYQTIKIHTSITLGPDGMLYYGGEWGIEARYPNGTIYWDASVDCVQSTPAVDENNIIYFGSHNYNIYAYYPNGTMKWSYQTGNWVHGSPTIAPDSTIYCGSDDYYVYAIYPNGTLKWKTYIDSAMRCSPSLDKQGNLYFGVSDNKLMSLDPDGNIRWSFTIGERDGVWGSTAAVSDDGTVYFGSHIDWGMLGGGEIIALDLDGNLLWRKTLCDSVCRSSPVIGEDGTVYICASNDLVGGGAPGYLHAFGSVENNGPPDTPTIDGPTEGQVRDDIKFNVNAEDDDNTPVKYFVDWDDGTMTTTLDFEPGISIPVWHKWKWRGTYTIKVKAIDTFGLESDWAYLEVTMPVSQQFHGFPLLQRLFERFPNMFPILRHLFEA